MLTAEQQIKAMELRPLALQIARAFKDDEAEGVADVALCEAIHKYDPEGVTPLRDYVWLYVTNAIKDWRKRDHRERRLGTIGGAPSREFIESQSGCGRMVIKTQDEKIKGTSRCLDQSIAARDNPLMRLVPLLPKRLQPVARARWLEYKGLCEIGTELHISKSEVQRQCCEAEEFARVFMSGGMV